jgi:hypothetical protein
MPQALEADSKCRLTFSNDIGAFDRQHVERLRSGLTKLISPSIAVSSDDDRSVVRFSPCRANDTIVYDPYALPCCKQQSGVTPQRRYRSLQRTFLQKHLEIAGIHAGSKKMFPKRGAFSVADIIDSLIGVARGSSEDF